MLGTSSSRKAVRPRRIRLLAWPRSPRRIMWCFERMALTICGITVSSYPTMPGKSGSFAFNIRSRFSRISSRTVLRAVRASVKWLRMRAPRVVGLFIRFSFAMISPYLQTPGGSGMVQSSLRISPCQRLSDAEGAMGGDVTVRFLQNLQHEILIGGHRLVADEPKEVGGDDAGPTPQLLVLGALGV